MPEGRRAAAPLRGTGQAPWFPLRPGFSIMTEERQKPDLLVGDTAFLILQDGWCLRCGYDRVKGEVLDGSVHKRTRIYIPAIREKDVREALLSILHRRTGERWYGVEAYLPPEKKHGILPGDGKREVECLADEVARYRKEQTENASYDTGTEPVEL